MAGDLAQHMNNNQTARDRAVGSSKRVKHAQEGACAPVPRLAKPRNAAAADVQPNKRTRRQED